jgi:hypothetical protein
MAEDAIRLVLEDMTLRGETIPKAPAPEHSGGPSRSPHDGKAYPSLRP